MMNNTKEKMKNWLANVGQSLADKLNHWINPLSSRTKKRWLMVMGVLTFLICVMLLVQPFRSDGVSPLFTTEPITTPLDIHVEENVGDSEQSIMEQYNRMIHFKELVEKMISAHDQKGLDSLMQTHPGLRDSLNQFLKQYY